MPFRPQGGRWCPVPTQQSRSREAPDRAPSSSCIGNASRPVAGLQLPAHASVSACLSPSPGPRRKPWFRDKALQEAWLPWVEGTCRAACCGLAGARRPRVRAAGSSCHRPASFLPQPPALPQSSWWLVGTTVLPLSGLLFLLFLFVNPGVSLPCSLPDLLSASSPGG